ncbi:MAG: type II toxin-antitoxin system RelE/ParE family toxin [Candidatus Xenobiia bacterium LiM19]
MQIVWTEAASQDLESIAAYIGADKPRAAALQVLRIIDAVESFLEQNPGTGRSGRVLNTRELVIPGTKYIVAYRVRHRSLQILRVLHGAMKWPEKF